MAILQVYNCDQRLVPPKLKVFHLMILGNEDLGNYSTIISSKYSQRTCWESSRDCTSTKLSGLRGNTNHKFMSMMGGRRLYSSYEVETKETMEDLAKSYLVFEEIDLKRVFACCPPLYKLHLQAEIEKLPEHHHFSSNLTKLILYQSKFEEGSLATLEKLPKLDFLRFVDATTAGKIVCSLKGFVRFKTLDLQQFLSSVEWQGMLHLSLVRIVNFPNLMMLSDGLRFITTLRQLKIEYMPGA